MQRDEDEGGAKRLKHQDHDTPDFKHDAGRERAKVGADLLQRSASKLAPNALASGSPEDAALADSLYADGGKLMEAGRFARRFQSS